MRTRTGIGSFENGVVFSFSGGALPLPLFDERVFPIEGDAAASSAFAFPLAILLLCNASASRCAAFRPPPQRIWIERNALTTHSIGTFNRIYSSDLNQPQLISISTNLDLNAVPAALARSSTWQWNALSPPNLALPHPVLSTYQPRHSRPLPSTYRCNEWTARDLVKRPE